MLLGRTQREHAESGSYRDDINALRAIAFLCVLLFHFRIPYFKGGYAGVDIFLVISGYLMTSILSRQLNTHNFNLFDFYVRRIARLFTPLVFMVVAAMGIGWFVLSPGAMTALGKDALSALAFVSNFAFWRESGYFDADKGLKFLLHTWALSLEFQFYLVFPFIFLLAVYAGNLVRRTNARLLTILTVFGISFILSVALTEFKPTSSFYLLPTRLWEFLAGALVFLARPNTMSPLVRKGTKYTGYALIILGLVVAAKTTNWPGWQAVMPVAGAALVIAANQPSGRVLGSDLLQWFGTISYSGYLWHWPIVALLVATGHIEQVQPRIYGLGVSLFLAQVSWFITEQFMGKQIQSLARWPRFSMLCAMFVLAAIVPFGSVRSAGFPGRISPETNAFLNTAEQHPEFRNCKSDTDAHCVIDGAEASSGSRKARIGAIVMGDSHAAMLVQTVADALPTEKSQVALFALAACPTIRGVVALLDFTGKCTAMVDKMLSATSISADVPAIVANRYTFYIEGPNETVRGNRPNYYFTSPYSSWSKKYEDTMAQGYRDTYCQISKVRRLYLVFPFPEFPESVPYNIASQVMMHGKYAAPELNRNEYDARNDMILPVLESVVSECGARKIDPVPALCPGGKCYGAYDGKILYTDSNHLTASGAKLLAPLMNLTAREDFESPVVSEVPKNARFLSKDRPGVP